MLKSRLHLGLVLLVAASWALGQQTTALVGTWVGKVEGYGIEMKLVLNADGSANFEGEAGRWRVQGSKLLLTQEGETVAYDFKLEGSQLTLTGGDLMAPLALSRAGGAAPPRAGSAERGPRAPAGTGSSAPPPASAKVPPGRPAGGARDSRFEHEKWGLSFTVPPNWKVGERQGVLLLGSDTEAGLIIIRLARRTSLEQLVQDYGEGMEEEGLQLMPTAEAQEFPGRAEPRHGGRAGRDGPRRRAYPRPRRGGGKPVW